MIAALHLLPQTYKIQNFQNALEFLIAGCSQLQHFHYRSHSTIATIYLKSAIFSPILSYGSILDHQTVRCSQIIFNVHRIFFNMKNRGHYSNVVSYTTLINEYYAIYGIRDVLKVFGEILVEDDKF